MFIYYELINHCLGKQFEDETFKIKMALSKCWFYVVKSTAGLSFYEKTVSKLLLIDIFHSIKRRNNLKRTAVLFRIK